MPASSDPQPQDDAFARLLFREVFQKRVLHASEPIFPKVLLSDAEDIIERALQRAYEKRALYRGTTETDLLRWVLVILRNLTRDILRSMKGQPLLKPLPEDLEDKGRHRIQATQDEELGDEIPEIPIPAMAWLWTTQSLLAYIGEDDRDVLLLRLGHGLSVRETAEILSASGKVITEAAVKMRQVRALKKIMAVAKAVRVTDMGKPAGAAPKSSSQESPEPDSEEE